MRNDWKSQYEHVCALHESVCTLLEDARNENKQLRQQLSDCIHQNKVDARKIMLLKQRVERKPFVLSNEAMQHAKAYAMEHGVNTRVHNGVVLAMRNGTWESV